MKIDRTDLVNRLKEKMDARYMVYGKELFLVERCCESIREAARERGYSERIALTAEYDFDWGELSSHTASMSLFGEKKIVEIRIPTGRPGVKGAEALIECVENQDMNTIVVVIVGNTEANVKKSKWFTAWSNSAVSVDNPMLNQNQFRGWIQKALQARNIDCESSVYDQLAYYFEGNMLAAANEIRKIYMGYDHGRLTVKEIERIVEDQGRFNVFAFVDSCMMGRADRSMRLLRSLHNEGVEPVLVLWALAREVRLIYKCSSLANDRGIVSNSHLNQLKIWRSKQSIVQDAVKRLGKKGCAQVLHRVATADRILKGRETSVGTIWDEFERIVLLICGVKPLKGI